MLTKQTLHEVTHGARGMLRGIEAALSAECMMSVVTLCYATIDAVSALSRPENQRDTSRATFVEWTNRYFLPAPGLDCAAIELYGARCGVLHTYRPESGPSNLLSVERRSTGLPRTQVACQCCRRRCRVSCPGCSHRGRKVRRRGASQPPTICAGRAPYARSTLLRAELTARLQQPGAGEPETRSRNCDRMKVRNRVVTSNLRHRHLSALHLHRLVLRVQSDQDIRLNQHCGDNVNGVRRSQDVRC